MMVMMMAITPSLKASSRDLFIARFHYVVVDGLHAEGM
jgi:hypothetical protein